MMQLNKIGQALGKLSAVSAMTDVTGFGLLGHLAEMCEGSQKNATIAFSSVPVIAESIYDYLGQNSIPGGTLRNLKAYGHHISVGQGIDQNTALHILADPQTSGGLLIAVKPESASEVLDLLQESGYAQHTEPIGRIEKHDGPLIRVTA
jgi:selenide,water dikinase